MQYCIWIRNASIYPLRPLPLPSTGTLRLTNAKRPTNREITGAQNVCHIRLAHTTYIDSELNSVWGPFSHCFGHIYDKRLYMFLHTRYTRYTVFDPEYSEGMWGYSRIRTVRTSATTRSAHMCETMANIFGMCQNLFDCLECVLLATWKRTGHSINVV